MFRREADMTRHSILGLVGLLWAFAGAQQTATLDFLAVMGNCEIDEDRDGRAFMLQTLYEGGVSRTDLELRLDNAIRYEGAASQRIRLQRSLGAAGRFAIYAPVRFEYVVKPEVREPLLIRLAIRAEGFQNATYGVLVRTGQRTVTLREFSSQDTGGWQVISGVVPVETDSNGTPSLNVRVEIQADAGAAQGTVWVDDIRALSARTVIRQNRLPNGIKLALTFLKTDTDPYLYLSEGHPFVITVGTRELVNAYRAHFPETPSIPYCGFVGSIRTPSARFNGDLYNYDDVEQNHPDWFLIDLNTGQRASFAENFYVDIGRPEVRQRALDSLRDYLPRVGKPRYVYLDNFDVIAANRFRLANYPTLESWTQAVNGWFTHVAAPLKNEFGLTFIPNVAWAPGYFLRGRDGFSDAPGVAILPYIAGFFLEHSFVKAEISNNQPQNSIAPYGSATGSNAPNRWERRVLRNQVRLVTEYPDRIAVLNPTLWTNLPNSGQMVRFALAATLIVQHDNTYLYLDPRRERDDLTTGYYPPEMFVPLGLPTETYRIVEGDWISGGLFVRNYQNGIVVWNPRNDRDFTFTVPRDLYDWDRNLIRAGTVVQIPRQTGHVFYSAPEIVVELAPQQVEVLPGQTIQFTVTYRNRGTAPGTNVRVAVPLPAGMTLVASTPTARLENGQVVWTVPSVPVNHQGTLQFTVRVE